VKKEKGKGKEGRLGLIILPSMVRRKKEKGGGEKTRAGHSFETKEKKGRVKR